MLDLQALVDGLNARAQKERAETQMTLGSLIKSLEAMEAYRRISGLGELDSYRGYYKDLAFAPSESVTTVAELLARCRAAMGQVFEGYKGGEFVMGARTPLWVAHYGSCGHRLMGIDETGAPIVAEDDV